MAKHIDGMQVFRPKLDTRNWKVAYGLECCRIWLADQEEERLTGVNPNSYIPTEDEFKAARAAFGRKV